MRVCTQNEKGKGRGGMGTITRRKNINSSIKGQTLNGMGSDGVGTAFESETILQKVRYDPIHDGGRGSRFGPRFSSAQSYSR